jgi:pSer/pThr/pTyr-binding forkhead associated (FHA) protein
MTARLFCRTGQLAGASYQVDDEATIGKGAENTIQLSPGTISRKHARIYFDKENACYFLEDLGSRNGTKVDGMTVKGTEKLRSLHIITFADECDFVFQVVVAAGPGREEPVVAEPPAGKSSRTRIEEEFLPVPSLQSIAPPAKPDSDEKKKTQFDDGVILPPAMLGASVPSKERKGREVGADQTAAKFLLEVEEPNDVKRILELKEGENIIGRENSCDICIVDSSMSRKHALVTVNSSMVTLRDLESKNHTFLDGQKITYEVELKPGAQIAFGMVKAKFLKEPAS